MPTRLQDIAGFAQEGLADADRLMALMAQDKKVKRGKLTFILLEAIGRAVIANNVEPALVRDFPATEAVGMRTGLSRRTSVAWAAVARHMSSISVNLLLAVLLLAANAFYVAAEFALVKSRGFRVKAMVEQNRFGARLLQGMMGDIEAYLACCQLGITMASLGLGWVGEPTVSALLRPLLVPLGMSESVLHFTSFLAGFLIFSSLHIVIGEQVPKTLAIRQPSRFRNGSPIRCFCLTWCSIR